MSDYERWTIYPLLLLTLGIVLKDKMLRPVADTVVCRNFSVVDGEGHEMIRMGVTPQQTGGLELFGAAGKPIVVLGPDEAGTAGVIVVHDPRGDRTIHGPQPQLRLIPIKPADVQRQQPMKESEEKAARKDDSRNTDHRQEIPTPPDQKENPPSPK